MAQEKYRQFMSRARKQVAYWRQVAMRDFTEDLIARFKGSISQAELAARLNVKPAYVSRILRGSDNFTLETMAKLALAVGGKVRIHIADLDADTRFVDYVTGDNQIHMPVPGEPIAGIRMTMIRGTPPSEKFLTIKGAMQRG